MKENEKEDLNREFNVEWNEEKDLNQYNSLRDKWNDIQQDYLSKYPELEALDLYYESGGFQGLLEKISSQRNKSVKEIRAEIENW